MAEDGEAVPDAAKEGHGMMQSSGRARTATGGSGASRTNKVLRSVFQSENLVLEPPTSMNNDVVMHRLEHQLSTMQANSFSIYTRQYDVLTGVKKNRADPAKIETAEASYVNS